MKRINITLDEETLEIFKSLKIKNLSKTIRELIKGKIKIKILFDVEMKKSYFCEKQENA
ncbi:hypothetical protein [uncultured archaeal virus]|uniref:Uncharacterized protein n=1 Tax=uncultured archaeal virus TaxID=1960247 RepID=A0A8B0LSD2_9VIRU|nr:hypothetical protein [uncultured archaeal virus]